MAEAVYCQTCGRTHQAFSLQYPGPYCRCNVADHASMIEWLVGKLADAEVALKTRVDMARTWRGGTDEMWAAAAAMRPSTAGKSLKRESRLHVAKGHARIATRMRRDVEMFKAVLAALGHPKP